MNTMKKEYIQPKACIKHVTIETPILGVSNRELGIGYGGVDEAGTMNPDAREMSPQHNSVWDD